MDSAQYLNPGNIYLQVFHRYIISFSGMCWSVSALLTVGYGNICPITMLNKIYRILVTFLGAEALNDVKHIDQKEVVLLEGDCVIPYSQK